MSEQTTETTLVPEGDTWYCPQCGRRFPGPGWCDNQHPAAELHPLDAPVEAPAETTDAATAVDATAEPVTEAEATETAADTETAVDTASETAAEVSPVEQAQSLLQTARQHLDDVTTLLARL